MRTDAERARDWRERNKGKAADYLLRRRYGIDRRDRDALLLKQRGRCAGCRRQRSWKKVVDHDHKTKKVRGVLCHHCNLILGHAKDNAGTLRRLACYLEK